MKEEAETLRVDFTLSKKSCIKKKEKEEKNYSYNAVHTYFHFKISMQKHSCYLYITRSILSFLKQKTILSINWTKQQQCKSRSFLFDNSFLLNKTEHVRRNNPFDQGLH